MFKIIHEWLASGNGIYGALKLFFECIASIALFMFLRVLMSIRVKLDDPRRGWKQRGRGAIAGRSFFSLNMAFSETVLDVFFLALPKN